MVLRPIKNKRSEEESKRYRENLQRLFAARQKSKEEFDKVFEEVFPDANRLRQERLKEDFPE